MPAPSTGFRKIKQAGPTRRDTSVAAMVGWGFLWFLVIAGIALAATFAIMSYTEIEQVEDRLGGSTSITIYALIIDIFDTVIPVAEPLCNDGNPCTVDWGYYGGCLHLPALDTTTCTNSVCFGNATDATCHGGVCTGGTCQGQCVVLGDCPVVASNVLISSTTCLTTGVCAYHTVELPSPALQNGCVEGDAIADYCMSFLTGDMYKECLVASACPGVTSDTLICTYTFACAVGSVTLIS